MVLRVMNSAYIFSRPSLATKGISNIARESKLPEAKRKKMDHVSVNMIELDIVSSDEET